jgi:hypothetical protein
MSRDQASEVAAAIEDGTAHIMLIGPRDGSQPMLGWIIPPHVAQEIRDQWPDPVAELLIGDMAGLEQATKDAMEAGNVVLLETPPDIE